MSIELLNAISLARGTSTLAPDEAKLLVDEIDRLNSLNERVYDCLHSAIYWPEEVRIHSVEISNNATKFIAECKSLAREIMQSESQSAQTSDESDKPSGCDSDKICVDCGAKGARWHEKYTQFYRCDKCVDGGLLKDVVMDSGDLTICTMPGSVQHGPNNKFPEKYPGEV